VTAFLEQLGAKIADRWVANLLLPGLLWLCCAVVAAQLGWSHAVDPHAVAPLVRRLTSQRSPAQALLLVAGVLGGSAAAGLTAAGLAAVLRRAWMLPLDVAPARWLRQRRARRWNAANDVAVACWTEVAGAAGPAAGPEFRDALARRDAIALEAPQLPTWIGDRWRAAAVRVYRAYGMDLTVIWPRLWPLLPDTLRDDIAAAQLAYRESSAIVSWAVFYGVTGLFWGPPLLIAAVLLVAGVLRARDATGNLCELVESACDLFGGALASQLNVACTGPVTMETGREISRRLRKDPPLVT
jgi:hypothetical protein